MAARLHTFKRLLPLYAVGTVLAVTFSLVAAAREWSDMKLALLGLLVASLFTVCLAVPYLIREQLREQKLAAKEPS